MLITRSHKKKGQTKAYFDVIWKHASELTAKEVMGHRGDPANCYHEYYLQRSIDEALTQRIEKGEHVIVIGGSLSGKTRTVFEALKCHNKPIVVTIPNISIDDFPAEIEIPQNSEPAKREILLIDDIAKYLSKTNFVNVLKKFERNGSMIVGTCWDSDWEFVEKKLEREGGIRVGQPLRLDEITEDEAKEVARETGNSVPISFKGFIGFILLHVEEAKKKYALLSIDMRKVLESVKRLYEAGVYTGREVFSTEQVQRVGFAIHGQRAESNWWKDALSELQKVRFAKEEDDGIHFEEAYLQYVVEGDFVGVEDFRRLVELFGDDPSALFSITVKSHEQGVIKSEKAAYMKVAISACKLALNIWTRSDNPQQYAMTQHNLGTAYQRLAEAEDEDTASNRKTAIGAFKEALRVFSFDNFPIQFAMTQNNLGIAYGILAEVEDRVSNCKTAIGAFKEALRVYSFDNSSIRYAETKTNVGRAYVLWATVNKKPDIRAKARDSLKEALRVFTELKMECYIQKVQRDMKWLANICEGNVESES
jgi:tetratricopeptide (TPR) repeat protein